MHKQKILIAEDDPNFGMVLQSYLSVNEFEVTLCADGEKAIHAFDRQDFDLCIFDVMMPNLDGFSLAQAVKARGRSIPFLFLTAKALKEDMVKGYQLGAIDYLIKPFDPEILLLKIRAILSNPSNTTLEKTTQFTIGNFSFDAEKRILMLQEESLKLSPKEAELLYLLCERQDHILKREEALLKIWKEDSYFTTKSMDVYITKLRKYLRKDTTHQIEITNLHGKGFVLSVK